MVDSDESASSGHDDAIHIEVGEFLPMGMRLDAYVVQEIPEWTRGAVQRFIQSGHLTVNGRAAKASYHPKTGDQIVICVPEAEHTSLVAQDIPLDILFEDSSIVVLNKPPGLVVHPAAGHDDGTLVNALLHHCGDSLSGVGGVARPGIVHRLDMDTSGCLVVAKNDQSHQSLSEQFSHRTVVKMYLALLTGYLASEAPIDVDQPIGRHPVERKLMAVLPPGKGREARTTFSVKQKAPQASLAEARLHTGRTHQIRVHAKYLGHPLVGDHIYGKKQNVRFSKETGIKAPRQMLHAWKLAFRHPVSNQEMGFEAPVPADFTKIVNQCIGPGWA